MNWDLFLEKLLSLPSRTSKDLRAVLALDEKLGFPHRAYKTIHVGGTNGKGSVSLKIAKSLEAEGFRVGLYTSPHVWDIRERIQINGEMISREDFQDLAVFADGLSFFDVITATAFTYFKKKEVDWAVIEVGLGGRFDATNVITPVIACITSIGYDHMQILGDTLEEIAYEKGGIVKPKIPLVVGPSAARFFRAAIAAPKASFFDLENQEIAKAVLQELKIPPHGIHAKPRCRFEVQQNVIYDVAHNPDGFKKLIEALEIHYPNQKFSFFVAFSKDKDWKACLDLIAPIAYSITAVAIRKERIERPEILKKYLPNISIGEFYPKDGVMNVVCGSFYLMDLTQIKIGDFSRLIKRC